jgi:excisionase family DNA binding protein
VTKRIVSIKGLAKLTGTHRTRLHDYIREGRIKPEYVDDSGHGYWGDGTAKRIATVLAEERATLRRGPGRKIELSGLKRKAKKEGKPPPTRLNFRYNFAEGPEYTLRHIFNFSSKLTSLLAHRNQILQAETHKRSHRGKKHRPSIYKCRVLYITQKHMEAFMEKRETMLRPKDVQGELGLSRGTIYRLINSRALPSIRLGKCILIPAGVLAAFLREKALGNLKDGEAYGFASTGQKVNSAKG